MWVRLLALLTIAPAAAEFVETRAAFQGIDRDRDGKISKDEFQSHATKKPRDADDEPFDADHAFALFDINRDEALTFDEFRIMAGDHDVKMSMRIGRGNPAPRGYMELHLLVVLQNLGSVPIEGAAAHCLARSAAHCRRRSVWTTSARSANSLGRSSRW